MSVPKRTPPGFVLDEKSSLKSISLTPRLSLSQNTDYPSKGWYRYQTVSTKESFNRQRTPLRFERRAGIQSKSKSTNRKATNSAVEQTHVSDDDEWVCPVAVVLRRAGFNVPLRPSKSWLERDRKTQALLNEKLTSSKD